MTSFAPDYDNPDDLDHACAAKVCTHAAEYRIGSRVTLGRQHFTLVALEARRESVFPIYVSDDYVNGTDKQFGTLSRNDLPHIVTAPDDAEKSNAAREWAVKERDSLSEYGNLDLMFETPSNPEQVLRFLRFREADRELQRAEYEQRQAARRRAMAIAQIAWADDNQSSAARLLGLNQATVSRAVAAVSSNEP